MTGSQHNTKDIHLLRMLIRSFNVEMIYKCILMPLWALIAFRASIPTLSADRLLSRCSLSDEDCATSLSFLGDADESLFTMDRVLLLDFANAHGVECTLDAEFD